MAETVLEKIEKGAKKIVEEVEEAILDAGENIKEVVDEVLGDDKKSKKTSKKSSVNKESKSDEDEEKINSKPERKEEMKIFDMYDIANVSVSDPGLKGVINLDYKLVVKSRGRNTKMYGKADVNIIERLANTIAVPGHRGKKHKIVTKWASGKYNKNMKAVLDAFKIIEEKTGENPIQVFVRAIEKSAPRDEVTMIQYGGARYPQAVDCAPLRRISLSLRNIVHGAYDKSFRSKKSIAQTLAEEIIETSKDGNSIAVNKKNELEKQADAAR